jgi:hypothetical protein
LPLHRVEEYFPDETSLISREHCSAAAIQPRRVYYTKENPMLIKTAVLTLVVTAFFTAAAWSNPDALRIVQPDWLRDTLELHGHFARERAPDVEGNANDGPLQTHQLVYDGIYFDDYWLN